MRVKWTFALLLLMVLAGCDDRATRVALHSVDQQARQNLAMADVNKQVATSTKQLLAADSDSRRELLTAHRELLCARNELAAQWNDVEHQRRKLDDDRRRESLLIPLAQSTGALFVVLTVLGFCWYALIGVRASSISDSALEEFLVEELVSESPRLLTSAWQSDGVWQIDPKSSP